eukprot:6492616-Amphidinium_carterae.2
MAQPVISAKTQARKRREAQALSQMPEVDKLSLSKAVSVSVEAVRGTHGQERELWKAALQSELDSLDDNRVFYKITADRARELQQAGAATVPARLVMVLKPDDANSGFKRKARIVACGNFIGQYEAYDVSNLDAAVFRAVLQVSSKRKHNIGVLDIRTAFLNADIEPGRVVVVKPPQLLTDFGLQSDKGAWVLMKALYGLKESPGLWSEHRDSQLSSMVVNLGGVRHRWLQATTHSSVWLLVEEKEKSRVEDLRKGRDHNDLMKELVSMSDSDVPSGYDHPISKRVVAFLCVYVDDLLVTAPAQQHREIMKQLRTTWKTSEPKILGENCKSLTYLGVVCCYDDVGNLLIHQIPYISDLIDKYRDMIPMKTSGVPGQHESFLDTESDDSKEVTEEQVAEMRAALGAILWIVSRTRPDLAWSHSMCATTLASQPSECLRRIRHLFGYLSQHNNLALKMTPGNEALSVYTDISFAPGGGKSHAGLLLQFGDSTLTWRTHKQSIVALSTGEAELYACVEGLGALRAARSLLSELGEEMPVSSLFCDNTAAITLSKSDPPMRSRHWSTRAWRLREAVRRGEVNVTYVATNEQRADSLMKSLSVLASAEHRSFMGLVEVRDA